MPVILDAGGMDAPVPGELLGLVDIFSPNETELARLTGMPTETFEQISLAAGACHKMVRFLKKNYVVCFSGLLYIQLYLLASTLLFLLVSHDCGC